MKITSPINIYFERYLGMILSFFAVFFLCVCTVRFFIISPGRVNGRSMEPAFYDETLFFVNRFHYLFFLPERFQVVQLIDPANHKLMIKRIVGLPGETIIVKRGKVFLKHTNGEEEPIDESGYVSKSVITNIPAQWKPVEVVLGENEYFILGDNREHSTDSRHYGPVSRDKIIGYVMGKHERNNQEE